MRNLEYVGHFFQMTAVWVGGLVLAAFLVLFWAMRGAPIGQAVEGEGDESPHSGYRDRVIAAMVLGLMLILTGAYVAMAHGVRWSLPIFVVGFGIVLWLIAVNRRYRHGSPALRRTINIADAALNAGLLAGVLIIGNVLAFRYGGRVVDFTREKMFSLASLSVNEVKALEKPVRFTVFYGRSPLAVLEMARVQDLLELYKAENPANITIETIDPYRDRDQFERLTKRVPDVQVNNEGGIVIEYGEGDDAQRLVVPNSNLFEFPRHDRFQKNVEKFISSFNGETVVTAALRKVREKKRPRVAFIIGHGEPSTQDLDVRQPGLGLWRSRLTTMGDEVLDINLLNEEIPRDVSVAIVVTGKNAFKEDEVRLLRKYLVGGGRLLMLVSNGALTGLDDFLKTYNITIGSGMVVDPKFNYRRVSLVSVQNRGAVHHPIVDPLTTSSILLFNGTPLNVMDPAKGKPNPAEIATPILRTSPASWAETDLKSRQATQGPDDQKGPLTVGVAVTDRGNPDQGQPETTPRLVVFGSVGMAENQWLTVEPANLDLLMNAVSWLQGRQGDVGISPKTHEDLRLAVDPILQGRLILVPTTMSVLIIVSLGLITYATRRE